MGVGAAVLVIVVGWTLIFFLRGQLGIAGKFWRRVGRNPERAIVLMRAEPDCIVDSERRDGYSGPFFFFGSDGQRHRVFILAGRIDEIQRRLMADLGN